MPFSPIGALLETALNRARAKGPYAIEPWARELMKDAVDLHADPLLWGRDLLERSARGQVDLPRLQEAGAALQVFGVVTQVPLTTNIYRNKDSSLDLITALAASSGWPRAAWSSRRERALHQARRLAEMAARSGGQLVQVLSRDGLRALLAGRTAGSKAVGALLALEGSQALEGDLAAVDALFDAGFRMMAPTHFMDTDIAGSGQGAAQGGLTALGREWLKKLEGRKIIVDLAHASPQTIADVLSLATRPVVVSHGGVRGTHDTPRNLSDDQLRALKQNGALIGIGYFSFAIGGEDVRSIARAMRHAASVAGADRLALGSDFDGAVATPFDASGVPLLAAALREEGFTDAEIRGIASENALRFLAEHLP